MSYLHLINIINDEHDYNSQRIKLLGQRTNIEQKLMSRSSTIEKSTDLSNDRENMEQNCLIIHYRHENRLKTLRRDTHRMWDGNFDATPIQNLRLIIGIKNDQNTKRELIHTHPLI